MNNARNERTTHPKIRARRERALERLTRGIKTTGQPYHAIHRELDMVALNRKLAQRKQGSAA